MFFINSLTKSFEFLQENTLINFSALSFSIQLLPCDINNELFKGLKIKKNHFWSGFDKAVHELAPKNKQLIKIREDLQKKIDEWHVQNKNNKINLKKYKKFLEKIGYLKKEGSNFKIKTKGVDDEITKIAGPQLD